jgi:hypothetical protein
LKSRILRRDLFKEEKSIDMRIVGERGLVSACYFRF